jgi:DNA-binding beta-propeller fold protein YncE
MQIGSHGDGTGDMGRPKGVAVDLFGYIYVVDAIFDTVQIFDQNGEFLLNFGATGSGPGEFWLPSGIFVDSDSRIYVADSYNERVQIFEYLGAKDDVLKR